MECQDYHIGKKTLIHCHLYEQLQTSLGTELIHKFRLSPQTSPRVKRVIQAHNHHSQDQTWLFRTFPNPAAVWTRCITVEAATASVVNTRCVPAAQEVFNSPSEAVEIEAIPLGPNWIYLE